jgi:hypothetical protein
MPLYGKGSKRSNRAVKWTAMLGILVCAGCASEPPSPNDRAEAQYRRVDARLAAMENLERLEQACAKAGGMVHVHRTHGRVPLSAAEAKSAMCTPP